MHIKMDKELLKGNYHVKFSGENLATDEFEKAIEKFGCIEVDFGGKFYETVETEVEKVDETTGDVTVEIETKEVEVLKFAENVKPIDEFLKYERIFKVDQYGDNAKRYANIYAESMYSKIESILDELRSKTDDFSNDDKSLFF